jgi:protein-S-isoprenylcysteine O-methyltransferase Ste14
MKKWKFSGVSIVASILFVTQYFLAFFVYKLPGLPALQWVGWGIWVLSVIFGIAPIFILRSRGGVAKGQNYMKTTQLVDSSLYAIVRHPQYLAGMLFNLSMMLLAQHWLVILVGVVSMVLFYIDTQPADQDGIDKFGEAYREYMQRVPRLNFLLGILRVIQQRRHKVQ